MGRTQDRKSGASTYKEIGCYKPSPSSSVLTGILLHSVPFLVRGLFISPVPLIGDLEFTSLAQWEVQGGRWPGGWTATAGPGSSRTPSPLTFPGSAPSSGSRCWLLVCCWQSWKPTEGCLHLLCQELPLSSVSLSCIRLPLLPWLEEKKKKPSSALGSLQF